MLIMLCASSPELAFRASYLELFLGCFSVWLIDMHQLLKQIQFKINILYSIMFAYVILRKSKLLVITIFLIYHCLVRNALLSVLFLSVALLKRLQPIVISWLLARDSSHGQTSL